MEAHDTAIEAEDVAQSVPWYQWLALGWQSVGVSIGLGALGWVVAYNSDGKTGAYLAGVLASIATALLLVGVLFGIQEQLKERMLEAVRREIEHQQRLIAQGFDEQRDDFRRLLRKLDERATSVRNQTRPREPTSAADASGGTEEAGDGGDDPPDVASSRGEPARHKLRFAFQDWLDEHASIVQRAVTIAFLIGCGIAFATTVVEAVRSNLDMPQEAANGARSTSSSEERPRDQERQMPQVDVGDDAREDADRADRGKAIAAPSTSPRRPRPSDFVQRRRRAMLAGHGRLRRLNRVMQRQGTCRLIMHRSVPAQAAQACGTGPAQLVVFAFRSPAAARRYLDQQRGNRRARSWDCGPIQDLSHNTQSAWWRYDALPGRVFMTGSAKSSPWRGIVLEC